MTTVTRRIGCGPGRRELLHKRGGRTRAHLHAGHALSMRHGAQHPATRQHELEGHYAG